MHYICPVILLLFSIANLNANAKVAPDAIHTYKITSDASGNPVNLTIEVFLPPDHQAKEERPAILFFFGGGWKRGSTAQFRHHCIYLASRGMVAMTAEYRVGNRHQTTPRECVMDGKSAIRWVNVNAHMLGIDPEKLIVGGASAGGQVAAAAAMTDGFNEESDDIAISTRPAALILFNPVYDNDPGGYGHERVSDYWEEFSPLHNIDDKTPPTIVFLGERDSLIPVETAKEYQRRMHSFGLRSDLHLYPNQGHGFFNYRNRDHYVQTVITMDRFLASLGYLEGEPTLKE